MLVAKAVLGWAILWFVTINLLGLVVRGWFYAPPAIDAPPGPAADLIARETNKMRFGGFVFALIATGALGLFLWWLNRHWNSWMAAAAVVVIVGRSPDLLWEIRTGQRVTRANAPKGLVYRGSVFVVILAMPLVWYSLKMSQ
jgi:hypothetical protein